MAQAHEDSKGCEATNDKFAESVFGVFDRMLKQNMNISREGAAALAQALLIHSFIHSLTHSLAHVFNQAIRAKSFVTCDAVNRRKEPKEPPPPGIGAFYRLPVEEQHSCVEYCRQVVRDVRATARADNDEHAAYVKAKVKTNSENELKVPARESTP